jgi:hypothetical protein
MYVCTVRVRTVRMERCASAARARAGFTVVATSVMALSVHHPTTSYTCYTTSKTTKRLDFCEGIDRAQLAPWLQLVAQCEYYI